MSQGGGICLSGVWNWELGLNHAREYGPSKRWRSSEERVGDLGFDLACVSNKMGGLTFAFFAKGGSRECLRKGLGSCHEL
jgi:hypothetical protein